MLIEFFLSIALSVFDLIIMLLPNIDFTGLESAITYFFNILGTICYFLPMGTVSAIFSIIYALFILRLLVGSIRALWGLIPIL